MFLQVGLQCKERAGLLERVRERYQMMCGQIIKSASGVRTEMQTLYELVSRVTGEHKITQNAYFKLCDEYGLLKNEYFLALEDLKEQTESSER